MKKLVFAGLAALGLVFSASAGLAQQWTPPGPVTMYISFPPGGGTDTQARLVAEELESRYGWKVSPVNVPGKVGLIMADKMKGDKSDGTVLGLGVTEALGYAMAAAKTDMTPADFTPIVTTTLTETAFVAPAAKGWKTYDDLIAAAKAGETIRVGAISDQMADISFLMAKAAGVKFNIVMVKGGRDMLNALNGGDLDAGFLAGLQAQGVQAGDLVELVSGLSRPLKLTPNAPLLKDIGVDYTLDTYFLFFAPGGMSDDVRDGLANAIGAIVSDTTSKTNQLLVKGFGGWDVVKGAELQSIVDKGYESSFDLMKAASE